MRVRVRAPSNIALIKYMGKKDTPGNHPENSSLSMTLKNLCTSVDVEEADQTQVRSLIDLTDQAQAKIKKHLDLLDQKLPSLFKTEKRSVLLKTQNSFPSGAGIASSASSFAAMTLAYALSQAQDVEKLALDFSHNTILREGLAKLSREGSGSSCRSFFGPFTEWTEAGVRAVESNLPVMIDLVVLVDRAHKKISSSEAHQRVKTSPQWSGRVERANQRFHDIKKALAQGDLKKIARLTCEDSADMHELFHTSNPSFSYQTARTHEVLEQLNAVKTEETLVTLDAGPNIHVIVPKEQAMALRGKMSTLFPDLPILDDRASDGPMIEWAE